MGCEHVVSMQPPPAYELSGLPTFNNSALKVHARDYANKPAQNSYLWKSLNTAIN